MNMEKARTLLTVDDVLNSMPARFQPENCRDLKGRIYWIVDQGSNKRHFVVHVDSGTFKIEPGESDSWDLKLEASEETYVRLSSNSLSGMVAMLSGRLKVRGNMLLAAKLDRIFI